MSLALLHAYGSDSSDDEDERNEPNNNQGGTRTALDANGQDGGEEKKGKEKRNNNYKDGNEPIIQSAPIVADNNSVRSESGPVKYDGGKATDTTNSTKTRTETKQVMTTDATSTSGSDRQVETVGGPSSRPRTRPVKKKWRKPTGRGETQTQGHEDLPRELLNELRRQGQDLSSVEMMTVDARTHGMSSATVRTPSVHHSAKASHINKTGDRIAKCANVSRLERRRHQITALAAEAAALQVARQTFQESNGPGGAVGGGGGGHHGGSRRHRRR